MTLQPAIGDYGIIGDCRSAALISIEGSIDWLCWPNFSADPVFCGLVDVEGGSSWSITPEGDYSSKRTYLDETCVLETTFDTESGSASLTDFMPVTDVEYQRDHNTPEHQIIRIIQCIRGEINFLLSFVPCTGFEDIRTKIVDKRSLGLRAEVKCGALTLQSDIKWTITEGRAQSILSMRAGETRALRLTFSTEGPAVLPPLETAGQDLQRTLDWWTDWSSRFTYKGPYKEAVQRSVLTLKLLQFAPTGAFVAAPTTSLPEKLGGALNWDYRFCWLRDASFNIEALNGIGYGQEAETFMEWMLHATRLTQPKLMTMYDLYGNPSPTEAEIARISGYADSRPVRTGNLAGSQHQLDTYGEVICGAAQIIKSKGFADHETQQVLLNFGKFVAKHWKDPDAGIWESRDKPSVHTHSRLLCWVALDELLKMGEMGLLQNLPLELFRRKREEIRSDIERTCWNEDLNSYISEPGTSKIDATLLLIALHAFEPANSDRLEKTYRKVWSELRAGEGLLYRNRKDGQEPSEGAFGICAFWSAQFLAMGGGTLEEARSQFETVLGYANDLGLYSEEIDPGSGAALGNFPQTFTHVGLISAALALDKRTKEIEGSRI